MGSQHHHHSMDSFQSLHLPPTFHTSTSSQPEAATAQRSAATQKTQSSNGLSASGAAPAAQGTAGGIKTENERTDKVPAPRKKRGQYKKTILRQQHEAAAAAAVAAGLPPPECPFPVKRRSTTKAKSNAEPPQATSSSTSGSTSHAQFSTIESLNVRPPKSSLDRSPTALEMEQELAMLAEEAEEDRKRRDEEAADRILKRAQVVNHLRSLKSKLASAQIQIGQDLHYQSMDLFSDIFDEVLEDIGKDNSEMLELIKNSRLELDDPADEIIKLEPTAEQLGHMPTRSSDRPRKRDLVSSVSKHPQQARSLDTDQDSDNEEMTVKRYKRGKGSDRFIGQTWDVADGDAAHVASRSKGSRGKSRHAEVEDALGDNEMTKMERPHRSNGVSEGKSTFRTREDLQIQHHLQLEQLQLQQRKDQEEFQRKQLEQLRDLQMRQNEESRVFEAEKAKRYRERMEGLVDKRATFIQPSLHHGSSRSSKVRRTSQSQSRSLYYEFDNGFDHDSAQELDDSASSRSASRSPSPQPTNRSREATLLQRGTPGPKLRHGNSHGHGHGGVHSFPMSTMTMALTAMNEKKRQMKRTQKKQHGLEDFNVHDLSEESADNSDYEQHPDAKSSKLLLSPSWGQKRSASDDSPDIKRRSTSITPSIRSSASSHSRTVHSQSQHAGHSPGSQLKHPPGEPSLSARYEQAMHRSATDSHLSSKQRTKKQKQETLHSSLTSTSGKGFSEQEQEAKPAIGFNKTLLSHFERWNPDTKTENFFDFVLSDPPDVEVDDSEVEGLLNRVKQPVERAQSKEINVTPTSNAFRWYQEQQRLAHEISRQPKMKSLNFEDLVDDEHQSRVSLNTSAVPNPLGATADEGLTLGVDPLAAFIPKNREASESPAIAFSMNASSELDNDASVTLAPGSSPMIGSSPAMNLLYSDDGEHDWGFNPFMVDSSDQYLHQESPLNSNHDDFELQF